MTIEELQKYLIKCCYWYYVKNDPIELDTKYDHLFHDLQQMELNSNNPIDNDSPTQKIYGEHDEEYPEWAKKL